MVEYPIHNMTQNIASLSIKTTANGRISGMSNRSPLNKYIDGLLHNGSVQEIIELKHSLQTRIEEAESNRVVCLKRFSRTNTRNSANAFRNADITLAALTAALKRVV
jgi:hypothetical protein